jgi:hypothetical protein
VRPQAVPRRLRPPRPPDWILRLAHYATAEEVRALRSALARAGVRRVVILAPGLDLTRT